MGVIRTPKERSVNNDIKHLKNGDFEVVLKRRTTQTMISRINLPDGRRSVLWLIDGFWEHKGWLMPQVP